MRAYDSTPNEYGYVCSRADVNSFNISNSEPRWYTAAKQRAEFNAAADTGADDTSRVPQSVRDSFARRDAEAARHRASGTHSITHPGPDDSSPKHRADVNEADAAYIHDCD